MNLNDALNQIIDGGIEAARRDYKKPRDKYKLEGAIAGFNECRGKSPTEISQLIIEAENRCTQAHREQADDYWYWRCRASEIEWVANVLSAIFVSNGYMPIVTPTARGFMRAAEIIGIRGKAGAGGR